MTEKTKFENECNAKVESIFRTLLGDKQSRLQVEAYVYDVLKNRDLTVTEVKKFKEALDSVLDILLSETKGEILTEVKTLLKGCQEARKDVNKALVNELFDSKLRDVLDRLLQDYVKKGEPIIPKTESSIENKDLEGHINKIIRRVLDRILNDYIKKKDLHCHAHEEVISQFKTKEDIERIVRDVLVSDDVARKKNKEYRVMYWATVISSVCAFLAVSLGFWVAFKEPTKVPQQETAKP